MTSQVIGSRMDPACLEALDELAAYVNCCLGRRVRDFQVIFKDGGLVLQGQTHTYHAKQLAQHHVMELAELPILANDIEVC